MQRDGYVVISYESSDRHVGMGEDDMEAIVSHIAPRVRGPQTESAIGRQKRAGYERIFNTIQR